MEAAGSGAEEGTGNSSVEGHSPDPSGQDVWAGECRGDQSAESRRRGPAKAEGEDVGSLLMVSRVMSWECGRMHTRWGLEDWMELAQSRLRRW